MDNNLDYYAHNNGLRNVNTTFKLLFALCTLTICVASPSPLIPLFIFILVPIILIFKAQISFKFYFKFISIPFCFALITFLYMALFFGVNDPWIYLGSLGPLELTIFRDGIQMGFLVFSRMLGAFSCLLFLAFTTPMTEIFSLLHRLRIPPIMVELSMLMYRFIFLFLDETEKMHQSQKTRLGYSNWKNSLRCWGMLGGNLFIRTWFQGEKLQMAMESRGYNGTLKTMNEIEFPGSKNIILLVSFELLLLASIYLSLNLTVI
jgi:cobalt/nickel transport system permease protein